MGRFFSQWARRRGRGWLRPEGVVDEDEFDATFGKLSPYEPGALSFNAIWNVLLEYDAREVLAHRRRQKVQLARYGRIGGIVFPGQDPEGMGWDDCPVEELQRQYAELSELLKEENGSGATEQ